MLAECHAESSLVRLFSPATPFGTNDSELREEARRAQWR